MVLSRPVLIYSEPSYWSAVDEIKNSLVDWLLLNFCSSSPNQLGLENIKCSEHLHEIQPDPPPPFSPNLTPKHTQRFFIGSLQVANLLICTERLAYILQEQTRVHNKDRCTKTRHCLAEFCWSRKHQLCWNIIMQWAAHTIYTISTTRHMAHWMQLLLC